MNPRYGTQNSPTSILKLLHVSTHIIRFHFWKHSAIRIISVCLSLIYCLTHVECFCFFDLAAIIAAPKLHTTTAVNATIISSSSSILRKTGQIYRSHMCGVRLSLGCSWLSTCFRHAFDLLATCFRYAHASRKPGLHLARIMECGLNGSSL